MSRRCFASDCTRLVMPAFGAYAGGLNVRDRAFADVFGTLAFTAHMLGERRYLFARGRALPAGLTSGSVAAERHIGAEAANQIRRDLADAADAEQRQVAVDLVLQQRDRALHAGLAAGDRGIEERPADPDEMRAERQRLDARRCRGGCRRRA